jgi:hypothetical protein
MLIGREEPRFIAFDHFFEFGIAVPLPWVLDKPGVSGYAGMDLAACWTCGFLRHQ